MTEEQKAAYIMSQSVCAMIEALGMMSDNQQRIYRGESIAYPSKSFNDLIEEYGIHNNATIGLFHQ